MIVVILVIFVVVHIIFNTILLIRSSDIIGSSTDAGDVNLHDFFSTNDPAACDPEALAERGRRCRPRVVIDTIGILRADIVLLRCVCGDPDS